MKKHITVFVLLFFAFGFSQKQEPVYILFNQNETATCQFPVKRIAPIKKIKLDYSQKRHRKINITRFILCRNIFVFEFKKNCNNQIASNNFPGNGRTTPFNSIFNKIPDIL